MFENNENLFKTVIGDFSPPESWRDHVYLAPACKERFLTSSDIPELSQFSIGMAGLADLSEGYFVERDGVEMHTLLFTLEGEGLLTTPVSQVVLKANTLTVLPANTSFRFQLLAHGLADEDQVSQPASQWKMAWMLLSNTEKWQSVAAMGQSVIPFQQCEQVWSLMAILHHEIGGRPSYRTLLTSELSRLLTGVEAKPSTSTVRVQTLFNEIESQLHLPWTVKYIAECTFISEEQLNRICKSLFSCSPRQRLITLRMEKAVDLLWNKDWSITMIAQRLGYKDPYNFTHRFKAYHGCSPRAYRKQHMDGS
jgi:AraC-like DNA-binding protein